MVDHDVRYSYPAGGAGRAGLSPPEGPAPLRARGRRAGRGTVPAVAGFGQLVAGLWLMVAPFALGFPADAGGRAATANDVVVGAVLLLIGSVRLAAPARTASAAATAAGLGAWLLAAPVVFGYTDGAAVGNDVAVGVAVLLLALAGRAGGRGEVSGSALD